MTRNDEMALKAVFFDAAGILYTRGGRTEEFALDLLRQNGFNPQVSPEQHEKQLGLREQANKGLLDHAAYWDEFLAMRGVMDRHQRAQLTAEIENYSNNVQPIPGVRETLQELRKRGFLLGIITDTMYPIEWKMLRLEKVGVADLIDIVACSTSLGVHKPDPAIYSHALDQTGMAHGEAVFVGHLGSELQGAHSAGMLTIAIDPALQENADHCFRTLPEILALPILQITTAATVC